MAGLTAKVFRTYNASYTMSNLLQKLDAKSHKNLTVNEKVKLYNDCNREVAILCNHKRTVGASHEQAMEKLGDRVCSPLEGSQGMKYLLTTNPIDQRPQVPEMEGEDDDPGRRHQDEEEEGSGVL
jgi:DNA topoisomerase-1